MQQAWQESLVETSHQVKCNAQSLAAGRKSIGLETSSDVAVEECLAIEREAIQ